MFGLPHLGPADPIRLDFPEEILENCQKDSDGLGAFPGIHLKSPAGNAKLYNSRRLKPPKHFQNDFPLSTAGNASFFRSGSGEGLSELVSTIGPSRIRAKRDKTRRRNFSWEVRLLNLQKLFGVILRKLLPATGVI